MPDDQEHPKLTLPIDFFLLGFLILVEVLVFGPFVGKVGFYLDDWLMISTMQSGPQDVMGALSNYFFIDPKVIIRPVEALHFGLLYFLFGSRPLGYHLVNGALEIFSAVLLYFAVKRFTGSRFLSFVTTAAFILYPVRDSTHYWILCSSVAFSLCLYLGSLILSMKALQEKKKMLYGVAALPFALSIFNYEVFMPFACMTAACVFLIGFRNAGAVSALRQAFYSFLPLFCSALALAAYQRLLVPHLGVGYLHQLTFDPLQILHVIVAGASVSSVFSALPFFQSQITLFFMQPFDAWNLVSLSLIMAGTSILSFYLLKKEGASVKMRTCLEICLLGAVAIVTSLSIFGLNKEYEPTLMTLVNRMFTGASLGWSCIFSALILSAAFLVLTKAKNPRVRQGGIIFLAGILSAAAVYCTLVNWQLAQPWVVSQRAQKAIIYQIGKMRGKVKYPDVIILSDSPRYVMWSPVFDGIWDFQSMVRVVLNDSKIQAGVVSERLVLEKGQIKDVSVGYTCASYPIENVKVYIPGRSALYPVASTKDFLNIVEANCQHSYVSPKTIKKWHQQIEGAKN